MQDGRKVLLFLGVCFCVFLSLLPVQPASSSERESAAHASTFLPVTKHAEGDVLVGRRGNLDNFLGRSTPTLRNRERPPEKLGLTTAGRGDNIGSHQEARPTGLCLVAVREVGPIVQC